MTLSPIRFWRTNRDLTSPLENGDPAPLLRFYSRWIGAVTSVCPELIAWLCRSAIRWHQYLQRFRTMANSVSRTLLHCVLSLLLHGSPNDGQSVHSGSIVPLAWDESANVEPADPVGKPGEPRTPVNTAAFSRASFSRPYDRSDSKASG